MKKVSPLDLLFVAIMGVCRPLCRRPDRRPNSQQLPRRARPSHQAAVGAGGADELKAFAARPRPTAAGHPLRAIPQRRRVVGEAITEVGVPARAWRRSAAGHFVANIAADLPGNDHPRRYPPSRCWPSQEPKAQGRKTENDKVELLIRLGENNIAQLVYNVLLPDSRRGTVAAAFRHRRQDRRVLDQWKPLGPRRGGQSGGNQKIGVHLR